MVVKAEENLTGIVENIERLFEGEVVVYIWVLIKRGMSATIEEWLLSAEYVLAEGNPDVILLCERGIRTFETSPKH